MSRLVFVMLMQYILGYIQKFYVVFSVHFDNIQLLDQQMHCIS
jgi:hypothetical protein